MKIAYLIIAHKNLTQVALFINLITLNSNKNFCFIHIDDKDLDPLEIISFKTAIKSNQFSIIPNPLQIIWGTYSMVEATLMLLSEAIKFKNFRFDYFSLHSGQDLPLKTNLYIESYLESNFGKQFLEYSSLPNKGQWNGNGGLDRLEYFWFIEQVGFSESRRLVELQKQSIVKKNIPTDIHKLYGGSQWWTITFDCAKYLFNTIYHSRRIQNYFKYSYIPDESIFHTLILNSSFKSGVINNNLRLIDWKNGPDYPKTFSFKNLQEMQNSKSLFARKFDIKYDFKIVKEISSSLIEGVSF